MSIRRDGSLPADKIANAIGSIPVPGDIADLVAAMSRRRSNVLRHRRELQAEELPIPTTAVDWYRLARRPSAEARRPSRCLAYAAGDYYLQDAGSLLALAAAEADTAALQGCQICDLCAAPGGKASALVEAIGDCGFVLANEPIRSRLGALALNLARTGSDRYAISSLDPQQLENRLGGCFDVVLVDAPCSGQALVSRGRQQVSSLDAKQIRHSAARQHRILDAAVGLLRDGGRLIYSTCTFAEAENESQVARLVAAGLAEPALLDRLSRYQTQPGCYRLWPHRDDCAGSFAAALTVHAGPAAAIAHNRPEHKRPEPSAAIDLAAWFDQVEQTTHLRAFESVICGWPQDVPPWVHSVAVSGPELAHRTGQTWKPAHAAALRRIPRAVGSNMLEVDEAAAKRFLRGEPIDCQTQGWQIVRWRGRPLGWIKADGRTGKNHLPKAARLRCD